MGANKPVSSVDVNARVRMSAPKRPLSHLFKRKPPCPFSKGVGGIDMLPCTRHGIERKGKSPLYVDCRSDGLGSSGSFQLLQDAFERLFILFEFIPQRLPHT